MASRLRQDDVDSAKRKIGAGSANIAGGLLTGFGLGIFSILTVPGCAFFHTPLDKLLYQCQISLFFQKQF